MASEADNPIVISLGGSVLVPRDIDGVFLKSFHDLIVSSKRRFAIICGGGRLARDYQRSAGEVVDISDEDRDWLGIHATRLNAHLLKTIFNDISHQKIIKDPTKKVDFSERLLIASGWKPGFSTDYDAVLLAEQIGATSIINMTNTDHVYDSDPKKTSSAKPYKKMSWDELIALVGEVWHPGLNAPFDPIAARKAKELGMRVIVLDGRNIPNLENAIEGKEFNGTIIED